MGLRRGQVVKAPTSVRATRPLPPPAVEDRWGPGRSEAGPAQNPQTVRDQTVIPNVILLLHKGGSGRGAEAEVGAQGWEPQLGGGLPSKGEGTWQTQAPRTTQVGPVLGRAQDCLQVLGQGANNCINVQLSLLQCHLLHRELVALCLYLERQW